MFAILKSKYIRCLIGIFVFIFVSFVTYSSYASVCFLPTGDCGGEDVSVDTNEDLIVWPPEECIGTDCDEHCTGNNCNNSDDTGTKCTDSCTPETGHRTCTTDSNGCSIVAKECSGNTYLTQAYCTSANSGKTCTQSGSCWVVSTTSGGNDSTTCIASNGYYDTQAACTSANSGKTCTQSGSCWVVNSTSCPTGYSLSCDKTKYTCALHTENSICKKLECNTANAYYGTYVDCTNGSEVDCYLDSASNCYIPSNCDITVGEYIDADRCRDLNQAVCVLNKFNCYEPYICSSENREYTSQTSCENAYSENYMGCAYESSVGCYRPICDAGEEKYFDQRTCEETYHAVCNLNNGCYEPYICSSENREYTSQTSCENAYSENSMGCAYESSVGCYRPDCDPGEGLSFDLAECEKYWDSCVLDTASGCYKQKIGDNCDETKSLYDDERVCEETWQSTCKVVDGCYKPTRFFIEWIGPDYPCRDTQVKFCDYHGINCDSGDACLRGNTIIRYSDGYDEVCRGTVGCADTDLVLTEGSYIIETNEHLSRYIRNSSTATTKIGVTSVMSVIISDDLGNNYYIDPRNQAPDPIWTQTSTHITGYYAGCESPYYYIGQGEFTFEGGRKYGITLIEGSQSFDCP